MSVFGELSDRMQGLMAAGTATLLCSIPWVLMAVLAPARFEQPCVPSLDLNGIAIALATFVLMEPLTWLAHKHCMHGGMWSLHEDHHGDTAYSKPQLYQNDVFPVMFAVPCSTLACLIFTCQAPLVLIHVIQGATLYGVVYTLIHEGIFHKRWWIPGAATIRQHPFMKRLCTAHGVHHRVKAPETEEHSLAYGFLYAPPRFSPELVTNLPRPFPEETLWSYYGPLFGFVTPYDLPKADRKG